MASQAIQQVGYEAQLAQANRAELAAHIVLTIPEDGEAITAISPLQFQKRLRPQKARRLMLGEHLDAASAGSRVECDDAAHFNLLTRVTRWGSLEEQRPSKIHPFSNCLRRYAAQAVRENGFIWGLRPQTLAWTKRPCNSCY